MQRGTAIVRSSSIMVIMALYTINSGLGRILTAQQQPSEVALYGSWMLEANVFSLFLLSGRGTTDLMLVGAPLIWAAFDPVRRAALCLFHIGWYLILIPTELYYYYGNSGVFKEIFTQQVIVAGVSFKSLAILLFAVAWFFARKARLMTADGAEPH